MTVSKLQKYKTFLKIYLDEDLHKTEIKKVKK